MLLSLINKENKDDNKNRSTVTSSTNNISLLKF